MIEELILVLRERKYIFTTKRQKLLKLRETILWDQWRRNLYFVKHLASFFFQERQTSVVYSDSCAKQLIVYWHG